MSTLYVDSIEPKTTGSDISLNGTLAASLSNLPAFSAHIGSGNPGLSANTWTKIAANTELFDTNNNYDVSNYRFTPTVAGYYKATVHVKLYRGGGQQQFIKAAAIYKNGSSYKETSLDGDFGYSNNNHHIISTAIVYLNGSSDYIEAYAYMAIAGNIISGGSAGNTFEAFKLIGA